MSRAAGAAPGSRPVALAVALLLFGAGPPASSFAAGPPGAGAGGAAGSDFGGVPRGASGARLPAARPSGTAPVQAAGRDPLYQVPYNGRFTFTRVRYGSGGLGGRRGGFRRAWAHDYPDGDRNLQTILAELTALRPNTEGSNVVELEDPEIFKHPILYISEPGYWTISEEGARNLRAYLLKGGFLIFDDFEHETQWRNMAAQVRRALPGHRWFELDPDHPIFRTFFFVEDIYVPHPLVPVTPVYRAIFEDDDPSGRIMVLANHNADLAEYWEWSPEGYFPVDPTNDAYRLGVNYVLYGMTH